MYLLISHIYLPISQLEFADLLLLNKCDLATEEQLGAVEAFLRKVSPSRSPSPSPSASPDPEPNLVLRKVSLTRTLTPSP